MRSREYVSIYSIQFLLLSFLLIIFLVVSSSMFHPNLNCSVIVFVYIYNTMLAFTHVDEIVSPMLLWSRLLWINFLDLMCVCCCSFRIKWDPYENRERRKTNVGERESDWTICDQCSVSEDNKYTHEHQHIQTHIRNFCLLQQ